MDVDDLVCEYEALVRWRRREEPSFSTGICESLTCGYGCLDPHGYWQFPLYPAEHYLEQVRTKTWNEFDNKSESQ